MQKLKGIGSDSIVTQAIGLVAADMDGEKVMLNIENGNYYGLDSIGSRIWDLIEKPHSIREVVAVLCTEYDAEIEICQHDVLKFLSQLHARGLVELG